MPIQEHSYPLPDTDISIVDRNSYGYLYDEMLPLTKERAAELFDQDLPVYLLYEDNTEGMALDIEDIDNHDGIFGVERADWITFKAFEEMKETEKFSVSKLEQPRPFLQRNYLETAEKSVEQNYNQLDGIINNKPTVTELEQKGEKKNSVVEQLKAKSFIEKDKQKKIPQMNTKKER
ncbi:DUF4316 domain-containing protein [Amphibacillus sp. Q70]|uniref:DUF4316 domain-containing protein n=1 Tax=Amphibacillus sp. Q70 TaxID=3453416 RepID=UPI003F862742